MFDMLASRWFRFHTNNYCSTANIAATLQVQRLKRGVYSDYTYSDCACDKMCCGYMSVNLQQPVTLQLVLLTEGILLQADSRLPLGR